MGSIRDLGKGMVVILHFPLFIYYKGTLVFQKGGGLANWETPRWLKNPD